MNGITEVSVGSGPPNNPTIQSSNNPSALVWRGRPQKHFRRRVGKAQSLRREPETCAGTKCPAARAQRGHVLRPLAPQIVAGGALEFVERPTRRHAQTERRSLARTRQ